MPDKDSPEYQRYQAYLLSPKWRRLKAKKLKQVGRKCQRCKSSQNLECHHLHYNTLYKERLSDLAIYCHSCHELADEVRKMETGRNTYMVKKYGERWADNWTVAEATSEFQKWLTSKQ